MPGAVCAPTCAARLRARVPSKHSGIKRCVHQHITYPGAPMCITHEGTPKRIIANEGAPLRIAHQGTPKRVAKKEIATDCRKAPIA